MHGFGAVRLAFCLAVVVAFAPLNSRADDKPPTNDDAEFFEKKIRPLLAQRCVKCHGPKKQESGLRLDRRSRALAGGEGGVAIVPGHPDESRIVAAINYDGDLQMPPKGKLNDDEIALIVRWVEIGAPWPDDDSQTARADDRDREFWSLQPIAQPDPPRVKDAAWIQNEIDRFILARLEADNLAPSRPAGRLTLLRRATFDLTGLPPTPAEIDAFVDDNSPDAFARVVDRLLNSRAYGERWGRHWLDVVRYADTAGETADFPAPHAWRYRNYVIDALNQDKPYDTFIREQLAGDILASQTPAAPPQRYAELITATGYLAIARRFGFDPRKDHYLTIEDTIDTLGKSFLGLTVACARCHDHKYDAITVEDYYGLYGIFASTRYAFPGSEKDKRPADLSPLTNSAANDSRVPADSPVEFAYAVAEGSPANVQIHLRGDPKDLGHEAPRKNIDILGGQHVGGATSGRLQLADWIASSENPLTPRVIVNRLWQHHFGRGLVATPNDFGRQGARPTHPKLLDWLARRFIDSGWSMKSMHRLIMLSSTYQAAADDDSELNRRFGAFARRRLSAEEIRDSLLFVGGNLDLTPGGAHPFPPPEKWNYTQHTPFRGDYQHNKRSIYLMRQRIQARPLMALFDGADTNSSTPRRLTSTVPTQALYFLNNELVHQQAAALAARLRSAVDEAERVNLAHRIALGRPADEDERRAALGFLDVYEKQTDRHRAWEAWCRVLLGGNEFVYVD